MSSPIAGATLTGPPVTLTPGAAPVGLTPPSGPGLLSSVVLANQSPYLVSVTVGTSQYWLAPWAADQYAVSSSNERVQLAAQPMPGLTQPAGTSAVVLPTWSEQTIPGTYPATLGQQATLAAGTQRIVAGPQTITWPALTDTVRVVVPLTACDRSILVYLNAQDPGDWTVNAECSGPTTGAIYAQDLLGFAAGGLLQQFRAMPAYGTADPTVNLDLTLESLTGGVTPWHATLIVIALPDALIAGRPFDPLDVVAVNGPPFTWDPSNVFSGTGNLASAVVIPASGADQVLHSVTSAVSTGAGAGRWHLAYGAAGYVANGQLGFPATDLGLYLPTNAADLVLNVSGLAGTDTWQLTVNIAQAASTG